MLDICLKKEDSFLFYIDTISHQISSLYFELVFALTIDLTHADSDKSDNSSNMFSDQLY